MRATLGDLQRPLREPHPVAVDQLVARGLRVAGRAERDEQRRVVLDGRVGLTSPTGCRSSREFRIDAAAPGWSKEFDAWAAEALARGDVDELASYRTKAPGMPYAHPTVEHYTPLFITLGAASDPETPGDQVVDGYWMGLSKRSLQVA